MLPNTLIEFILTQAAAQPVKKRIQIYRALAPQLKKQEMSNLLALAEDLEKTEHLSREFTFDFSKLNH